MGTTSTITNRNKIQGNPYFHTRSVYIYNDDILKNGNIEEKSIDLIITSPPYNVDIKIQCP